MSDALADQLLRYHTPTQIQRGFKEFEPQSYTSDEIAGVILKGKYGFRRGYRRKLAKPRGTQQTGGDDLSLEPQASPEEQATQLEAYLQAGTLPSAT